MNEETIPARAEIPAREEIPAQYTWNAPSVFESYAAWESESASITASLGDLGRFQGHLADGPAILADALEAIEDLMRRVGKVYTYAGMDHHVDVTDQRAAGVYSKAQGLYGKALAAIAFFDPELLAVGEEKIRLWMQGEPRLAIMAHYVDNLFRKQAHVRSAEVEEVLGMLADPFSGVSATVGVLTNADFQFEPAISSDGKEIPVTHGTLDKILTGSDREARRTAWEHYTDTYLAFKNTLATNLATSLKQNVFRMRARRHNSTLEASLFENNIPVEVFHNLIATFRDNIPIWHHYWAIRRKALGVETLHPYDIWAPLTDGEPYIAYPQAVDWICEGLMPMGEEYVSIMRQGCLKDRWVDVYPSKGKGAGAFSSGSHGTYPFIMMSYNDNLDSLSTLAHELGHSMHSYLTWQNQPVLYGDYSLFAAEVASNFHQAMVRAHLLKRNPDPAFQISLIEEAMSNFHRYFFIMPTLARFELETHERVERGEGLTSDDMIGLMADLFTEAYGNEMHVDRQRVGITWATFEHLYMDYYVYQYATGISAAHALSKRILSGDEGAVDDYLSFLSAGGSMYALDALKMAGLDLTTPQAVEVTFEILSGLVDRLEKLVAE
jgi:oligoendopeptidase F